MSGGDELNDIFGSDDENGENLLGPKIKEKQKSKTVSSSSFYIDEIPKLNPTGYSLTLRLPNFLKIATSAYESCSLEREDVETKIYQEATSIIRWRFSENNELESNARLVKFKNGEYQLIVGGEVFEGKIVQAPLRFAFMKQTNNPPAKLNSENSDQIENENENTLPDSCLECIGEVNRKININPSSVDSEAHARIAMNSTMKHRKTSRMKSLDKDRMAVNPEKEKEARKIAHSDEMKRERRLQASRESSGGGSDASRRYLSASFLEEGLEQQEYDDDDGRYDSYNIKNLKRKSTSSSSYKRSSNIKSISSSSKPVKKSRPSFVADEEEEEEEEEEEDVDEYEDDEEEEEEVEDEEEAVEVVTKKKKKQFVQEELVDEEEEEEDVRITEEIMAPKRPKVAVEPHPPPRSTKNNTTTASASQETPSASRVLAAEPVAAAVAASDSSKTDPVVAAVATTTAAAASRKRTSRVIVDSDDD